MRLQNAYVGPFIVGGYECILRCSRSLSAQCRGLEYTSMSGLLACFSLLSCAGNSKAYRVFENLGFKSRPP